MNDETSFTTDDPRGGAKPFIKSESTIFNTSVRGWMAMIMVLAISVAMLLVVMAPYFDVSIPTSMEASVIPMFAGLASVIAKEYFNQKSTEGQTSK